MPIEIKELVIKATVSSDTNKSIASLNNANDEDKDNKNAQKIINDIMTKIKNRDER
jgi:hypothetical protein